MHIFQHEINDGLGEILSAKAHISYASAVTPLETNNSKPKAIFNKTLASVDDSDLYYTQSVLVSSSWNKNDDIFDKAEIWAAKNSPEDKPTNLEHDESIIIGHIVSNWPITEDGELIDENTSVENLPDKFHILTGSVIYKAYTQPELRQRTEALIQEIENGSKYVSMECFFKGFDYGLINKVSGEYKVLPRNESTAFLTKHLRAYGGLGEHENYKIGRVLRNITFSGKGYVDRPANPDSIIFSRDGFKFINNSSKNDDNSKSGVVMSKSSFNSENNIMNENTEVVETIVADCVEATQAAETTIVELNSQIDALKTLHEEVLASMKSENESLAKMHEDEKKKMQEEKKKMQASIEELENKLIEANNSVAAYMKKEKKMARKTTLMSYGFDSEKADVVIEKLDSLNDETFANVTEILSAGMPSWLDKKKKDQEAKADEVETDITEVLENVETTEEVAITVGGEDDSNAENTRAALVDFVYARLGKKLNKGE
jgi:hypothetical protein